MRLKYKKMIFSYLYIILIKNYLGHHRIDWPE